MLKVYNTMTRSKEEFIPTVPGKVSIYCCGVTPYNDPHVGNARPFVVWDAIRRYFKQKGYEVRYVQNFTDVDDKIIRKAQEKGVTWKEIADQYIQVYFKDIDALNVRRADVYPRVSEHMEAIVSMIQKLMDKGYAYPLEGDVYYSVEKFADYGKLSGRTLDDMQAGARVGVDARKHNPMDFALWKAAKPGEPSWPSSWGKGRPGWHIECSTMSLQYLGETFDFHGGGSDLIFPHHENEIAQSVACVGHDGSFARYWLHNGFITIHDEKMSKSKNNFLTVSDILKEYSGETVRFFILQTHYRSPLDFSEERLQEAERSLGRLRHAYEAAQELLQGEDGHKETAKGLAGTAEGMKVAFYEAMDDDFNTALAISHLFALAKEINIYYANVKNDGTAFDKTNFQKAFDIYMEMAGVIGILEAKENKGETSEFVEQLMGVILGLRQEARNKKDWALSDRIRDDLRKIHVIVEDSPEGQRWKRG